MTMQYKASTTNRTALPRSKRMRALGAASVTPTVVNGESGDKYWNGEIDTETEETEVSTTYPVKISKRLRIVDESGALHGDISIDANGRFVFDKGIISKEDIIAYGVGDEDVKSVTDVIEEYLKEHGGGGGGGDVNWGGITGNGNAVTNITYDTTTKQLSAVKGATFLTEHQSLQGYATENWVNNKGYLTRHQDISGKANQGSPQGAEDLYTFVLSRSSFIGTYKNTTTATWYNVIWDAHGNPNENGVLMWKNMQGDEGWKIRYRIQSQWYTERTLAYTDSTVYSAGRVRIHNHNENDIWYPVVWSNSNSGNSYVDTQLFKSNSNFMYNPSRKAVRFSQIESLNSKSSITLSDAYLVLGYNCVSNGIDTYLDGKNIHLRCGTSWTEAITINSSANVGVGTTSASGKMHIYQSAWNNGLVLQRGPVADAGCGIRVLNNLGNQLGIFGVNGSKNFELGLNDANGTEQTRLYVLGSNGNVGIGTISPSYKLHVEGSIYSNGNLAVEGYSNIKGRIKTTASTSTTGGGGLDIGNCQLLQLADSLIVESGDIRFGAKNVWDWSKWAGLKYDSGSKKIYLGIADGSIFSTNPATNYQTGGTVQLVNCGLVASGDVTAYSDRRLKSDIKELKFRGSLAPKEYFKDGKRCIGFIAQEVRELYPELVQGEETDTEYLSLNYGAITAVLASENKELHKKVESLEERIEKLETLINKLIEK